MSITQRDTDICLGTMSDFFPNGCPPITPSSEEEPKKKVQRPPSKNKGIRLSEHMNAPEFSGTQKYGNMEDIRKMLNDLGKAAPDFSGAAGTMSILDISYEVR